MKVLWLFKTSGTAHPVSQRHIPGEPTQPRRCEHLRDRKSFLIYDRSMTVKLRSKIQTVKLHSGRCRQAIKGEHSEQLNAVERKRRYAYVTVDNKPAKQSQYMVRLYYIFEGESIVVKCDNYIMGLILF